MLTKQELRQVKPADLHEELQKALKELTKVVHGIRTKSSKESHQVRKLKRYIARIHTIEKEEAMKTSK